MSTRNLVPRASGEGGIGITALPWGSGSFNSGVFKESLTSEGNLYVSGNSYVSGSSYFTSGTIYIGNQSISSNADRLILSSSTGILFSGGTGLSMDTDGVIKFGQSGLSVGGAIVKEDPDSLGSLLFTNPPVVRDAQGNPQVVLTADTMGLGTYDVLTGDPGAIQFKLLTDQERFVIGTTGQNNLGSGWYRFNDYKVKNATDLGGYPLNPVDSCIYTEGSTFLLLTADSLGNPVCYIDNGSGTLSANNQLSVGISARVDNTETPRDLEFTDADDKVYSIINGDSDSRGANGLPASQGLQSPSVGAYPVPLLIDGGYF